MIISSLYFNFSFTNICIANRLCRFKFVIFRGPNDILIPPDMNKEVQEALEEESIPYEVIVWDLEKAIKYENPMMSRRQRLELENEHGHPMTWHRYHNFEDISIYLDHLQMTYPDLVDLIHIGRSFEGRPIMVAKVRSYFSFALKQNILANK